MVALSRRIPSLDGIRAIAVVMVIASHYTLASGHATPAVWLLGDFGVKLFFVLSGFLITSLLLSELGTHGGISIGRFYLRRMLRIFPAFYVYLLVMGALLVPALVRRNQILVAGAYLSNYFVPSTLLLIHTWSLSVEEQFYLLWPMTLALLGRRYARWPLALVIVAAPIARGFWLSKLHWWDSGIYRFECVADSLAWGCVAALFWEFIEERLQRVSLVYVAGVIAALGGLFWISSEDLHFAVWYGLTLSNIGIAFAISAAIVHRPAWLNIAPLRAVGVLSYSLYLWQEWVFLPKHVTPVWVAGSVAAGCASYWLIERPILHWRKRLAI